MAANFVCRAYRMASEFFPMRKAAGKRLPHGVTGELPMGALLRLSLVAGKSEPVQRADLVQALNLPETTVDDRLRVLVKRGQVVRLGRGLYAPAGSAAAQALQRRQFVPNETTPIEGGVWVRGRLISIADFKSGRY